MTPSRIPLLLLFGMICAVSSQDLWSNLISRVPEGVAGVDYPNYTTVPKRTSFTCRDRKPGFYADPETRCQGWHWCDTFLIKHSFLCPNMTVFSQKIRGCDWWYNVDCNQAVTLYANNDELYRPSPAEEARRAKKVTLQPDEGRSFGAAATVPAFGATDASGDGGDHFFSATSPPVTRVSFPARTFDVTSPVVATNPSTRGVLRVRPSTRVPPPSTTTNDGFDPNRAAVVPIAFPQPKAISPTSPDFDFDAALAAVTGGAGLDAPSSPASAGSPTTIALTSFSPVPASRLRPTRFRTQPAVTTFVPSAAPSTPSVAVAAPSSTFGFEPEVAGTFLAHAPTRSESGVSDPSDAARTTSFFEITLDALDGRAAASTAGRPTSVAFFDLPDVSTASTFQNDLADTEPLDATGATVPTPVSFAPFPGRSTARVAGPGQTPTRSSSATPISADPTRAFDFGIPFGARIAPAASEDNAITVRRSDAFVDAPTTTFVDGPPSFPTTFASELSTTPKSTESAKSSTAEAASTTRRRTFPSFPITTFKPSSTPAFLTRATFDGTFGDRDVDAATETSNATSAILPEAGVSR